MPLKAGSRLGPFEVLAQLGAGGMGEVYRARDARLGREVAIKVLPDRLCSDPEALRHFELEARAVAALSHPNVVAIHDIGTDAGHVFAVAELLEGETLRRKLSGGALPVRRALEYALQIAHGMAAAHEKGIVHRDLKPENVFITRDGQVKILDFGLAKFHVFPRPRKIGDDDTLEIQISEGVVVGTFGYLSPEEIRGREADHRGDIFSFGAILYELLSGRRAFPMRNSPVETLNSVLKDDPPPLPDFVLRRIGIIGPLVRRCLEKNPDERFQSARDVGYSIEAAAGLSTQGAAVVGEMLPPAPARGWISWLAAAAAAGLVLLIVVALFHRKPSPMIPSIEYVTHSGHDYSPAASPDGKSIAFASDRDGRRRIWLKDLTGGGEAALTEGEDDFPRFSPDGTMLLFVRTEGPRTSLYRKAVVGGEARRLIENTADGDWSPDGKHIAFVRWHSENGATSSTVGLADGDGAEIRMLAEFKARQLLHPRFSPDGSVIAVPQLFGMAGLRSIFLLQVKGGEVRSVTPSASNGWLSAVAWTGLGRQLVYSQADSVVGAATGSTAHVHLQDAESGKTASLLWTPGSSRVLDVVGPGSLVFDVNVGHENLREVALAPSRKSEEEARWLTHGSSSDRQPAYSPDGERLIFSSNLGGNLDLWSLSLRTGSLTRVTDSPADDWDPAFTPDGRGVLWSSNRGGHFEIWTANVDGSAARVVSHDGADAENPTASPDGRWVIYNSYNPAKVGIWKVHPDGTGQTRLVAGNTLYPEISPDGQFIVYRMSPEPGRASLCVARTSDGGAVPFQVNLTLPIAILGAGNSVGRPRWMPDERGVAYVAQDDRGGYGLFLQPFDPSSPATGPRRIVATLEPTSAVESFGIAPDGSRITLAVREQLFSLMIARNVSDLITRGPRR